MGGVDEGEAARAGAERTPEEEEVPDRDGLTRRGCHAERGGGMVSQSSLPAAMWASTNPRLRPCAPPLSLPPLRIVAPLHDAVVAAVGEIFVAAPLEVYLPEGVFILRAPAGIRRLLRRERTPDVADGVFPIYALWDGRHGNATGGEVPPALASRGSVTRMSGGHRYPAWASAQASSSLVQAEVVAGEPVRGGGIGVVSHWACVRAWRGDARRGRGEVRQERGVDVDGKGEGIL